MLATTRKPLTDWERSLPTPTNTWRNLVSVCTAAVGDTVAARELDSFVPLHELFDDDTSSVFLDDFGHIKETANRRVVAAIVDKLLMHTK